MPKKRRKKKRIKINYKKFFISILVFLLTVFLLVNLLVKTFNFIFLRNNNSETKKTITEEKIKETGKSGQTSLSFTIEALISDFDFLAKTIEESSPSFKQDADNWKSVQTSLRQELEQAKSNEDVINIFKKLTADNFDSSTKILEYKDYSRILNLANKQNMTPWLEVLNSEKVKSAYSLNFFNQIDNFIPDKNTLESQGKNISFETPVADKLAVIKIKSFNDEFIKLDQAEISSFLRKVKDYEKLIIDIRGLDQGDNSYWISNLVSPLAKEDLILKVRLAKRNNFFEKFIDFDKESGKTYMTFSKEYPINELPPELNTPSFVRDSFESYLRYDIEVKSAPQVEFKGKIIILQDENVKNAGDSFLQFARFTSFAQTAGKTSGGLGMKANFENAIFALPETGLLVEMPSLLALNQDGSLSNTSGTGVDFELDSKNIDYKSFLEN